MNPFHGDPGPSSTHHTTVRPSANSNYVIPVGQTLLGSPLFHCPIEIIRCSFVLLLSFLPPPNESQGKFRNHGNHHPLFSNFVHYKNFGSPQLPRGGPFVFGLHSYCGLSPELSSKPTLTPYLQQFPQLLNLKGGTYFS